MKEPAPTPPKGGKLPIRVPPNLTATYANFALITNSRSEIVIDFAQIMPQQPHATVQARIVMTALNAKLLSRALAEHIERFESQYGEIEIPKGTSLAEQLFKPSPSEEE